MGGPLRQEPGDGRRRDAIAGGIGGRRPRLSFRSATNAKLPNVRKYAYVHSSSRSRGRQKGSLSGTGKSGEPLTRVSTTKARVEFSDIINRVSYGRERIILKRRGKDVVALVPVEDLRFIEEIEDRIDLEEAKKRLREESDRIPWEKIKKRLGL